MNLVYFIRLLLRHIVLLIVAPILVVAIVFFLTKNAPRSYKTNASVYTGIATGSSIVSMEESKMDLFGTRTAFDNLINIISSRNTIEEVGIRLLATHLSLQKPNKETIQKQNYNDLMKIVPDNVKGLVVKGDFNRTLNNLKVYKKQDPDNFIYALLNYNHPHYSTKGIRSKAKVNRVQSSDMIDIQFTSDDPGICKQTLDILIEVFIEEYSGIKVNQSDAVVKYFQGQIDEANERLNQAENELLQFNRSNNIVNYYEQTKHIASENEHVNLTYMEIQMDNAAAQSAMKALEGKMNAQEKIRLNSSEISNLRNQLAKVNLEIALKTNAEQLEENDEKKLINELSSLQTQSFQLKQLLSETITKNYNLENTTEGVSTEDVLKDWLDKMIEFETTKAKLKVGSHKQNEFRQLFSDYAPLGAIMKRLERKIDVAEREYLALLHSLNVAKLKQQNIELNSNLKIVAAPFYPIVAEPSKQKMLLVIAFLIGFIIPAFSIILLEFLDQNIRNAFRAESWIGLNIAAIFPVLGENKNIDFDFVKNRGLDIISRRLILNTEASDTKQKPDISLIFSILEGEGKSMIIDSLLVKLKDFGYSTLLIKPKNVEGQRNGAISTVYYNVNKEFHRVSSLTELEADWSEINFSTFDYIFIEIPGILNNSYPIKLFKTTHHSFLITRANRPWTKADKHSLKDILEFTKENKPQVLLNGVALEEMESVLGDLPKNRTFFRRVVKNFLRLRFFSQKSMGYSNRYQNIDENDRHGILKFWKSILALLVILVCAISFFVLYPILKPQNTTLQKELQQENVQEKVEENADVTDIKPSDIEVPKPDIQQYNNELIYQVVAGVYLSRDNARQSYNLNKQFGFEPEIVEIQGGKFRVVVGSYKTKEEAEKIRKEVVDFVPHSDPSIHMTTGVD